MNIALFMGHPAHFHYLKNVGQNLLNDGHKVFFVIKKKDILEDLMHKAGFEYTKIREDRGNSKIAQIKSVLSMEWNMAKFIRKNKIDILIGSTLTFATRVLCGRSVITCGEDDANIVPYISFLTNPFTSVLLTPTTCSNWYWEGKSVKYPSYHELAYLHPNHFTPNKEVVEKYGIDTGKPYFILRFASLKAHHDAGIQGINTEIAQHLIDQLLPHGRIYITSERELEPQFEQYRIKINPLDMHHVMAFASLYIGDSQTMAAEAGVLGTPFVRFNDFVGRIGYLRELEDVYHLGYGIHATPNEMKRADGSLQPSGTEALYAAVDEILALPAEERRKTYQTRREQMLNEKIDYAKFLTWFIENYPASIQQWQENRAELEKNFKIKPSKIVLDTNAFYDFCHVLGLQNCGVSTGINQRVDYHAYKAIIEEALRNKSLFIPATTVFEFVCKLRNDEEKLKNILCFLKEVSRKYSYDILGYNQYDNYGILFGFDQFSDEYWSQIHANYEELITLKDKIMLTKIGSESEIMTFFSRIIIHLFVLDYFYGKPGYDILIESFNRFFLMNPMGDGVYRTVKKSIAYELLEHYQNNEEGKYKKTIFESTIKVSAYCLKAFWDFMYESFLKKEKEKIRSIDVEFESKESIQTNLYKWFNIEKTRDNLSKNINCIITIIQKGCDFNGCQLAYLENSLINLFTHGTKREKNDAEDYWNLGFVSDPGTYLISFEMEILEVLRRKNINNYNFVCEFYNCE